MPQIRKMVIPVAGFGTRMLPATKSIPKEMVPIVDKPVIHYLVEEAVNSGIEEVILVNHPSKKAIEDYFRPNADLEQRLIEAGKEELLAEIRALNTMAKISVAYQEQPLGNGHAILMAKELVGNEPFAAVWGDDIVECTVPRVKQLIETYEEHGGSVFTLIESSPENFVDYCKRYACVGATTVGNGVYQISSMIEKPAPEEAPSNLFSIGGYILTPKIFELLEQAPVGKSGEIWLIDAAHKLLEHEPLFGRVIDGTYWDIGNKLGFLKANVHYALKRDDIRSEFQEFLKTEQDS